MKANKLYQLDSYVYFLQHLVLLYNHLSAFEDILNVLDKHIHSHKRFIDTSVCLGQTPFQSQTKLIPEPYNV